MKGAGARKKKKREQEMCEKGEKVKRTHLTQCEEREEVGT